MIMGFAGLWIGLLADFVKRNGTEKFPTGLGCSAVVAIILFALVMIHEVRPLLDQWFLAERSHHNSHHYKHKEQDFSWILDMYVHGVLGTAFLMIITQTKWWKP